MCYRKDFDEWLFINKNNTGFYYYPSFSWGTIEGAKWYAWNSFHDDWVTSSSSGMNY